jgi:hypothetical protein
MSFWFVEHQNFIEKLAFIMVVVVAFCSELSSETGWVRLALFASQMAIFTQTNTRLRFFLHTSIENRF